MLVHLRNQEQIAEKWPPIRDMIKARMWEAANANPSYVNNLLTHAMIHPDDFQLCLYFFPEKDINVPASFFILDMAWDSLLEKKVCSVPVWIAIRRLNKLEVQQMFTDAITWIKGHGCKSFRIQTDDDRIAKNELYILQKLGAIQNAQLTFGWTADIVE